MEPLPPPTTADPFPLSAPAVLSTLVAPLSAQLGLTTLPLHIHELIFSFALYHAIFRLASPLLSARLLPRTYAALGPRARLNWDLHATSMVQCLLINALALRTIFLERAAGVGVGGGWLGGLGWRERLWGYSGAAGMVQGLAAGYFAWDVYVSALHMDVMGPSSLMHGVAALVVTCVGFKPFANHYGLRFILYELSTPFLNIHWFLDKLGKTGSRLQLVNGLALLASFFLSRLVWGSYQSLLIYRDVWSAWAARGDLLTTTACAPFRALALDSAGGLLRVPLRCRQLPASLALFYVGANTALGVLNFYWFGKMVAAVRKRFGPDEQERLKREKMVGKDGRKADVAANSVNKDHFE